MLRVFATMVILLVLLCNVGCSKSGETQLTEEEIAIFVQLARSVMSKHIVLSNDSLTAYGVTRVEDVRSVLPTAPEAAIADFLTKNIENLVIENDVEISDGFVLLASNDREPRLSGLHRYNAFSRVGFDETRESAVVYYLSACNPLCGEDAFYLLKKSNGKWGIAAESEKRRS